MFCKVCIVFFGFLFWFCCCMSNFSFVVTCWMTSVLVCFAYHIEWQKRALVVPDAAAQMSAHGLCLKTLQELFEIPLQGNMYIIYIYIYIFIYIYIVCTNIFRHLYSAFPLCSLRRKTDKHVLNNGTRSYRGNKVQVALPGV